MTRSFQKGAVDVCSANELKFITERVYSGITDIFPGQKIDMILFGSYARGEQEDGSDIDLMVLVDSSRAEISQKIWEIGACTGEILCEQGVVVSPIVENRDYFWNNTHLPFFRNIQQEGVPLYA